MADVTTWATLISAAAPLFVAVPVWMLQRLKAYVKAEVTPHLTNGDTGAASYARQSRDVASKALDLAVTTDARVGRLETKLDAVILAKAESLMLRTNEPVDSLILRTGNDPVD